MSKIGKFRKTTNQYFGGGHDSPLTPGQLKGFMGLQYFPENTDLQFVLSGKEFPKEPQDVIEMSTSTGNSVAHVRSDQLKFEVDGTPVTLTVYSDVDGNEFSLPFMDTTTDIGSDSGGRYLDLTATKDGRFVLAYHLYCAFNSRWSYRIPLAENRLRVSGYKAFTDIEVQ